MTTVRFYRHVIEETGARSRAAAERGVAAVLKALRDRLTPDEARQAAAQLPRELKRVWMAGETPGRKPLRLHRLELYERVRREAGLKSLREARLLTRAVFAALKAQLSQGEAEDILAQLPRDLKDVWAGA